LKKDVKVRLNSWKLLTLIFNVKKGSSIDFFMNHSKIRARQKDERKREEKRCDIMKLEIYSE